MSTFRFIDLFAGVGGFHHALADRAFGGECVLAVEIDEACRRVYSAAFPDMQDVVGDIRTITRRADGMDASREEIAKRVPDHEVLCAGFPCQPFSKSGAQLGIRDQIRGTLFFDIMEVIRAKTPRFVILENVPNLVGPRHKETWRLIKAALREAGYRVSSQPVILSPHRIPPPLGAPQQRDRVFILAVLDPGNAHEDAAPLLGRRPDPTWSPNSWNLARFLGYGEAPVAEEMRDADSRYRIRPVEEMWLSAWDAFLREFPSDHIPGFPLWMNEWTRTDDPDDVPPWKLDLINKNRRFYREHQGFLDEWRSWTWDSNGTSVCEFPLSRQKFEWQARRTYPRRAGRTLWSLLIHLRPSGIRVKAATYAPALVAITQTSILGELRRRLTPAEAALLQGIPYRPFLDAGLPEVETYRQLGNAVNVGAVQLAASTLFAHGGETWGREITARAMRLIA